MKASIKKRKARIRLKKRIRKQISPSPDRPRLSIFRSNNEIYAQIIDDGKAHTMASAGSLKLDKGEMSKTEVAEKVGETIAQKAIEQGIKQVVFDRNGFKYHGRVKALAEGARKAGLEF